ncbi:MAG: sulfite exporter TauE/SafE family protein [Acidimicrobiia bacterium]|nr:MAG: sulfite exporter TauE/SafE family protein [Acidimicrobiia bacterium]
MPIEAWILALVITFAAALTQGIVGVGFAMVSVPLLALIDPRLAPVPQLLVAMPLTMTMAWRERAHIEMRRITWIIVGRLPGAIIGVALLAVATQVVLDLAIATIVLLAVAIIGSGYVVARNSYTEFGAGVLSGTTGLVASIGGPPLALLYADETGPVARSNLATVFSVGLSIALVARALSGNIEWGDVRVAAILLPALLVGYLLSGKLKDRLNPTQLRSAILILSTIGAVGLIVRALF